MTDNVHEFTVSEISQVLKQTVEQAFSFVRVRGEISGLKRASSGHVYFSLKDENAVLNGICWKGLAEKLPFSIEDGLEVIATGKITTYQNRSNYQIIVEWMEPAGIGALMALLEKRKQELAKEGLFSPERKKKLPYMPSVIGVITSPTGAVIRDILHRLSERFPAHVLLWPVPVQGEGAAEKIAAAIKGFNNMPEGGEIPRPDVLIVARGGGSLEDLWAFNEEIVVRAVASSSIPLISAVGHETDTTLIDLAADKRAPTPTAAAEIAVPVRDELMAYLYDIQKRLFSGITRFIEEKQNYTKALARGLVSPRQMMETMTQRLDDWSERLAAGMSKLLEHKRNELKYISGSLTPQTITQMVKLMQQKLEPYGKLLESYHYKKVLARGFALVRNKKGKVINSVLSVTSGMAMEIEFHDGRKKAVAEGKNTKKKQKKEQDKLQKSMF